jgi:hypothetical protein
MNMELDDMLGRLAAAPVHPGLMAIDNEVFARIREDAAFAGQARVQLRIGGLAAFAALALGLAAGSPIATSSSPTNLAPFDLSNPLAPSTLLAVD